MSRIGKQPIAIPAAVKVEVKGQKVHVTGPKGKLDWELPKTLKLRLKYEGKKNIIEGLKRVSTPGLRRYVGATEIPRVLGGMGVSIVSTSEGLMTGTQAKKKNIGGELLCYIW